MQNVELAQILTTVITVVGCLLGFVLGRFISNKSTEVDNLQKKINYVDELASSFIAYADQFMKDMTGEEKMDFVVDKLSEIIAGLGYDFDDQTLKAIAQKTYNSYKAAKSGQTNSFWVSATDSNIIPV